MKQERIGPAARGDEADVLLAGEHRPSTPSAKKQQRRTIPPMPAPESGVSVAEWRQSLVDQGLFLAVEVVSLEEMGPVHLIGGTRVCLGFGDCWTMTWLERRPWGARWANAWKISIDRDHVSTAIAYALRLARSIRKAAFAEEARRERIQAEKLQERLAFIKRELPHG